MADPALTSFTASDEFLRRVRFRNQISKNGLLRWQAFKEQDERMSWTFRDDGLRTATGLDDYHAYFSDQAGEILPAILSFTFFGLTARIDPPLEPRYDRDPEDPKYGHLHCSSERPRNSAHMKLLAKMVNDGEHAWIERRYANSRS